jgi:hypothetical protein
MPPTELARTVARLHESAAGSLATYVARPKDDEEIAHRDLAASAALGQLLSQLACQPDPCEHDSDQEVDR